MRMLGRVLFGAAALVLSAAVVFAQATAQLNGRVTDESGAVLAGVTVTATGITGQRVDQVLDDPFGNKTLDNYLNPAAFAYPATGSLGSHVRASIEGPAYWSVDLALARKISFGAGREIELRLETFNLMNHFNWGNPTLNFDAADFGRIRTQSGTPRILQFGVKYGF